MNHGDVQGTMSRGIRLILFICISLLIGTGAIADDQDSGGPDLVLISEGGFGDPQNNYAWSVAEFNGDVYVGTGRNIPYFVAQAMKAEGVFPENWTLSFLTSPGGSPPPPFALPNQSPPSQAEVIAWSNDMRGEIWRYHEGEWSEVHTASTFVHPLNGYTYPEGIGYRAMTTFTDANGTESLYAGVGFGLGRILLIQSSDGITWMPVNTSSIPSSDTRAMISHHGRLYVGTGEGIYASGSPSPYSDTWEKVADFETASLKSFNGYLYAGTGNPIGPSETNGFEVWRSTVADPSGSSDWVRIVSGGAGDAWNVLAATMQEYEGDLYVGSLNLPFGTGTDGVKGFDLIRLDTKDSWDLIVGDEEPRIPTDPRGPPLSGWPSGFRNPFNLYAWSMEEYDGNLYLGTYDIFSFARFLSEVPGGYEILMEALGSVNSADEDDGFASELGELADYGNSSDIVPIIELLAENFGGADLWTTPDGVHWAPVDLNGFDDPNNYGFRTLMKTTDGMIVGTANPFEGCQIWILSSPAPTPPDADFTAVPRSGTAPLIVSFIDLSTGTPPRSYFWDFGDGSNSTEKNPLHQYQAAGSYSVTQTVTNEVGESTEFKESYVSVGSVLPLEADFTSNVTTGTPPLVVQFYDASAGNPCAWSWVFEMSPYMVILNDAEEKQAIPYYGNEFSAEKDPVVTYTRPGNYTVSLTVSRTGETDMITKEEYIQVIPPPPDVEFSAWPEEGEAPLEVEFWENLPYGYYYDEFLWDFGDGTNGTGDWLYHTYEDPGLYNVTLTVNSPYGSGSLTKVQYINVTQPLPAADFTGTPLSGNAPMEVEFTDMTTGAVTSRLWDFGDGTTAWENTTPVISHAYPLPGVYTVSLTTGNDAGQATTTKEDYIQVNPSGPPPVARFTSLPAIGYTPMTVRFTDRSMGTPIKWQWDFGDGNSSSEQNPHHTYTASGRFRTTLTVYNSGGSSSYSSYLWARPGKILTPSPTTTPGPVFPPTREHSPVAVFRMNQTFGSSPMSVQFTDLSFNNPASWLWQFGDDQASTLENPVHTFEESGTYTVRLTVTNDIGASTTSRRVYVT